MNEGVDVCVCVRACVCEWDGRIDEGEQRWVLAGSAVATANVGVDGWVWGGRGHQQARVPARSSR